MSGKRFMTSDRLVVPSNGFISLSSSLMCWL